MLEPLGLYKFTGEESIRWSIEDSKQTGLWYSEGIERITWGDAEAIAEWGACAFLQRVSPMLERFGVPPLVCEQEAWSEEPKEYRIRVNGKNHLIFPKGDPDWEMLWVTAPARTYMIVEELLKESGAEERAYTPKGEMAGEASILLLTEEMYHIVNNSPLVPDDQKLMTQQELVILGRA